MNRRSENDVEELARLTHSYEEGDLDEKGFERMQEILRKSEEAREEFVRMRTISAGLHGFAGETLQEGGLTAPRATMRPRRKVLGMVAFGAAALIFCGLWIVSVFSGGDRMALSADPTATEEVIDRGVAVITNQVGVRWGEGQGLLSPGDTVATGDLSMEEGLLEIEFFAGATVVLEGAAEIEVLSTGELRCSVGNVRVRVPPHARGFVVSTPTTKITDLGTEFAVSVDRSGKTQLRVFEGSIEVAGTGFSHRNFGEVRNLAVGQSGVVSSDGHWSDVEVPSAQFAGTGAVDALVADAYRQRHLRWIQDVERHRQDSRLLLYYPFLAEGDAPTRLLKNAGAGVDARMDGAVVGCRWTDGRWPGKRGLSFQGPGDRVRVNVPGEYEAVTFAAWVRIGGLDRKYNSLFLTDRFKAGNPHWQIEDTGKLILGIRRKKNVPGREWPTQEVFFSPALVSAADTGRWIHLASTYDTRSGVGVHYRNGEEVSRYQGSADMKIVIGDAELGNWGLPEAGSGRAIRNLNGSIDEFFLFSEALAGSEVRALYQGGDGAL